MYSVTDKLPRCKFLDIVYHVTVSNPIVPLNQKENMIDPNQRFS
jgi:hypothetical protein